MGKKIRIKTLCALLCSLLFCTALSSLQTEAAISKEDMISITNHAVLYSTYSNIYGYAELMANQISGKRIAADADDAGNMAYYAYDDTGKVICNARAGWLESYTYDAAGFPVRLDMYQTSSDGSFILDENGQPVSDYVTYQIDCDEAGRPVYVFHSRGLGYEYSYDEEGRIKTYTFHGDFSNTRTYYYNSKNQIVKVSTYYPPDAFHEGGTVWETIRYNRYGEPLLIQEEDSTTKYSYHQDGTLKKRVYTSKWSESGLPETTTYYY